MLQMEKMDKKPVRFKARHDIYLLKCVILKNPFAARYSKAIHDAIAVDMNNTYGHEGFVVEGRRVRERYQLLLRHWQLDDCGFNKKSSETEEEYNEKIQLLQECTELQMEAEKNQRGAGLDKSEPNSAVVMKAKIQTLLEENEEIVTKDKLKSLLDDSSGSDNGFAAVPVSMVPLKSIKCETSHSQHEGGASWDGTPSVNSFNMDDDDEDTAYATAVKKRKHNDSEELHDYFHGHDGKETDNYKQKELKLKERELELKERELELREKELNWQQEQAKGNKDEKAALVALLIKHLK